MAPRKRKPTTAASVVEVAPAQPAMTYLTNPVAVAHATPRTRDEIAIRDTVRKALAETEGMVAEFVAGQMAEGFSLADIDQLYALELPILFGYRVDGGRIRSSYDAQIIERAG
ncbi:hypothetical protein GOL99_12140 [Sinorhizobium medicae]|nr:hypothetical protein [Sinorhizobium medicae]